jgi:hypothetical protein
MTFHDMLRALGITDAGDALKKGWEESQATLPEDGIPFLAPGFARTACREVGLSEEIADALERVSRLVASSKPLAALAWHCHRALFATAHHSFDDCRSWPSLAPALGPDGETFYLLVLLSGVPRMRQLNAAHRIPAQVERETLADLIRAIEHRRHRDGQTTWGLRPPEVAWFANFIRCELYRLGRLQFQFSAFYHKARAFRHVSGVVLALSEPGVRYAADGQLARSPEETAFTAQLSLGASHVSGNPILPTGCALPRAVSLPWSEWKQVLAPGDPVLNVHMPGGGPLAHDACGDSFRRALQFFPAHFPERKLAGFCCHSWLLDAQLQDMLPPTSNIVRFQREVYLLPAQLDLEELLRTALGPNWQDLANAPRRTTLQRALVDRLQRGEKLRPRAGGLFLLPDDLNWGSQVYRSQNLDRFLR